MVEFYNRGGDFHEQNIDNLDADIEKLNLTEEEQTAIVAFLKSLTDERVRFDRAPFDHPELTVTNGHPGNSSGVVNDGTGKATVNTLKIPAVGRNGRPDSTNFPAVSS